MSVTRDIKSFLLHTYIISSTSTSFGELFLYDPNTEHPHWDLRYISDSGDCTIDCTEERICTCHACSFALSGRYIVLDETSDCRFSYHDFSITNYQSNDHAHVECIRCAQQSIDYYSDFCKYTTQCGACHVDCDTIHNTTEVEYEVVSEGSSYHKYICKYCRETLHAGEPHNFINGSCSQCGELES